MLKNKLLIFYNIMIAKIDENIKRSILELPRSIKQVIAILSDLILCILCTWFAFYIRFDYFISIEANFVTATLVSICLMIPIFWMLGL